MQFFDPTDIEPQRSARETLEHVRTAAHSRRVHGQIQIGMAALVLVVLVGSSLSFEAPRTTLTNVFKDSESSTPVVTSTTTTTTSTTTPPAGASIPPVEMKFVSVNTDNGYTYLRFAISGAAGRDVDRVTTDWGDGDKLYEQSGKGGLCPASGESKPWTYENQGVHQYRKGGKYTVKVSVKSLKCVDNNEPRADTQTFVVNVPMAIASNGTQRPVLTAQVLYDHVYTDPYETDGFITQIQIIWPDQTKVEFNYPLTDCRESSSGFPTSSRNEKVVIPERYRVSDEKVKINVKSVGCDGKNEQVTTGTYDLSLNEATTGTTEPGA